MMLVGEVTRLILHCYHCQRQYVARRLHRSFLKTTPDNTRALLQCQDISLVIIPLLSVGFCSLCMIKRLRRSMPAQ